MRIQDIIRIIEDNFFLAFIGVAILAIFLGIGYFFIYKKLLKGNKSLSKRKVFIWFCFIGYMIMVAGVTFIGRGVRQYGDSNLHFLSTYRQAWNSFHFTEWRQLILNIIMLMPLGVLLPLLNKRFYKLGWTFGSAFLLTLTIETMQLLTGYGVFDLDDIFNNILGAIIGYGLVMAIITLVKGRKNKYKKTLLYILPIIIVIGFSIGVVGVYNSKEFGNLFISYSYRVNMKNIELNLNTEIIEETREVFLDESKKYNIGKVPIYKAPSFNEDEGLEFFKDFLKEKDIEDEIEIDSYDNMAIYRSNGEPGYHMWFYFNNGSYNYTDFSSLDEGVERIYTDEDTLINELEKFNISIPQLATFSKDDDRSEVGAYVWNIDNFIEGDYLTNGRLLCEYYNDDSIKAINNNIVKYKKVKDIEIKSKDEVFKEIEQGKFNFYYNSEKIEKLNIEDIKLDYILDTKGYYQPIYVLDVKLNNKLDKLLMPAI